MIIVIISMIIIIILMIIIIISMIIIIISMIIIIILMIIISKIIIIILMIRRESGKSVKSRRGSGSVTPVRDLEIPPFRLFIIHRRTQKQNKQTNKQTNKQNKKVRTAEKNYQHIFILWSAPGHVKVYLEEYLSCSGSPTTQKPGRTGRLEISQMSRTLKNRRTR